jgi:hypothetical protein
MKGMTGHVGVLTARSFVAAVLWILAAEGGRAAEPADVEGSRDPPLFLRHPEATIYDFASRERDLAAFALDGARVVQAEGRYTLVRYRYPPGMSCAAILARQEAALRERSLRVYTGASLPDEAARSLGAPAVEGWITGVGNEPDGRTVHAMAACSAGGLAASGHFLVVETRPLTMRGRGAPRPAFDTAPLLPAPAEQARDERPEIVLKCAPYVKVQVGAVGPVEVADADSPGFPRWRAHFAPAAVTRRFVVSGSTIADSDGELVCRYKGEGDLADQSMTMTRPVPSGRTCVRRREAGEFRCVRR